MKHCSLPVKTKNKKLVETFSEEIFHKVDFESIETFSALKFYKTIFLPPTPIQCEAPDFLFFQYSSL